MAFPFPGTRAPDPPSVKPVAKALPVSKKPTFVKHTDRSAAGLASGRPCPKLKDLSSPHFSRDSSRATCGLQRTTARALTAFGVHEVTLTWVSAGRLLRTETPGFTRRTPSAGANRIAGKCPSCQRARVQRGSSRSCQIWLLTCLASTFKAKAKKLYTKVLYLEVLLQFGRDVNRIELRVANI